MRYLSRPIPYEEEALRRFVYPQSGLRVGFELNDRPKPAHWQWCKLRHTASGLVERLVMIRDCTEEEAKLIQDLLRGEVVLRYQEIQDDGENPWALVSLV